MMVGMKHSLFVVGLMASPLLSGCIAASIGAGLLISEGTGEAMRGSTGVRMSGYGLYASANWRKESVREMQDTALFRMFNNSTWVCATRTSGGGEICIDQTVYSNFHDLYRKSRKKLEAHLKTIYFNCDLGQGGIVSTMVGRGQLSALFCEKVEA